MWLSEPVSNTSYSSVTVLYKKAVGAFVCLVVGVPAGLILIGNH